MIPSVGRIVHYRLGESDASQINKRRSDASVAAAARGESGVIVHVGNTAREGDIFPLVITRVFAAEPTEDTVVNGQVLLDGNDNLWVTSRGQGAGATQWSDPRG